MVLHQLRHVAQVGDDRHFRAFALAIILECESHRIGRVVRNRKRGNFDVTNEKSVAGMEMFHVRQAFVGRLQAWLPSWLARGRSEVHRRAPQSQNLRQSADVIAMFVGNYDAVEFFNRVAQAFKTAKVSFLPRPASTSTRVVEFQSA